MKVLNPKALFQKDRVACATHQDIVDNGSVVRGLHIAFENFCWNLKGGPDVQSSIQANAMREGAREFIREFLTLAEVSAPAPDLSGPLEREPGSEP